MIEGEGENESTGTYENRFSVIYSFFFQAEDGIRDKGM